MSLGKTLGLDSGQTIPCKLQYTATWQEGDEWQGQTTNLEGLLSIVNDQLVVATYDQGIMVTANDFTMLLSTILSVRVRYPWGERVPLGPILIALAVVIYLLFRYAEVGLVALVVMGVWIGWLATREGNVLSKPLAGVLAGRSHVEYVFSTTGQDFSLFINPALEAEATRLFKRAGVRFES